MQRLCAVHGEDNQAQRGGAWFVRDQKFHGRCGLVSVHTTNEAVVREKPLMCETYQNKGAYKSQKLRAEALCLLL